MPLVDADTHVEPAPGPALGRALAVRRLELGLSRRDLATRSGLSYPFVCEIERGAKQPSAASLRALARALSLAPADLLARADALDALDALEATSPGHGGDAGAGPAGAEASVALAEAARGPAPGGGPTAAWREPGAGARGGVRAAAADDLSRLVRGLVRDELARLQAGGAPPMPGPGAAPGAGADAGRLESDDEVRAAVLGAARQMLGSDEIEFDAEGDIPIKRGDVMLFIRVLDDPLSVLVFSPMIVAVTETTALLTRLNEMNAGVHFIRFCVTHGGIVADIELMGELFRRELLEAACTALTTMAETTGPELQREFGGRLFFSDEPVVKPPRDTGGYL